MNAPPAARSPARAVVRRGRVAVHFDYAALPREDAAQFAALTMRGLRELENLADLPARVRLRFVLSADTRISSARGHTIHLPVYRVLARTAPYLHEIAHVLLPCLRAPAWFSEGLAGYLEAAVSERGAGYDSHLFTPGGNAEVHVDAARWLADPRGQSVLPFVGTRGTPPRILADRHNVAAPFYVLSHSLVKFVADQAGLPCVVHLTRAVKFPAAVRRLTGKPASAWRASWLGALRAAAPSLNLREDGTRAADRAP